MGCRGGRERKNEGARAAKTDGYRNALLSKFPHTSRKISLVPTGVDHRDPSLPVPPDMDSLGPQVNEFSHGLRAGVLFWLRMPGHQLVKLWAKRSTDPNLLQPPASSTHFCLDIIARSQLPFMAAGFVPSLPLTGFSQRRAFDSLSPHHRPPLPVCQPFLHQLYLLQSSPVNCHSLHTDCQ